MTNDQKFQIVCLALIIFIIILVALCVVYFVLWTKKRKEEQKEKNKKSEELNKKMGKTATTNTHLKTYTTKPMEDFMTFDKIEDNMIVKKEGLKYLMVIECQGVNYDLMSTVEKTGVEEGFLQFLNTLRHPVQIYVQTRTINLENSLQSYRVRISEIEKQLQTKEDDFKVKKESGKYSADELNKMFFDLTKTRNLYEYGKDIVRNTELMSQNKNVLNKQYYVIIPYFVSETTSPTGSNYDIAEIRSMAFSELYTRSQAVIRTLAGCGVTGKILDSNSIIELLYIAYNRDESEVFDLRKAIAAGYDELYSTAPDVLDKKIALLNKEIEDKAYEKANKAITEVKNEKEEKINDTEENYDSLIDELATMILDQNKSFVGEDVAEEAKEKIKNESSTEEKKSNSNVESQKRVIRNEKIDNIEENENSKSSDENQNTEPVVRKKKKLPDDPVERERILKMRKRKKMRELQKMREGM